MILIRVCYNKACHGTRVVRYMLIYVNMCTCSCVCMHVIHVSKARSSIHPRASVIYWTCDKVSRLMLYITRKRQKFTAQTILHCSPRIHLLRWVRTSGYLWNGDDEDENSVTNKKCHQGPRKFIRCFLRIALPQCALRCFFIKYRSRQGYVRGWSLETKHIDQQLVQVGVT